MLDVKEVLVKLGMAIYLHKALIEDARKGKEAVEYLEKMGVWIPPEKTAIKKA